jgi:hypothetical protein
MMNIKIKNTKSQESGRVKKINAYKQQSSSEKLKGKLGSRSK